MFISRLYRTTEVDAEQHTALQKQQMLDKGVRVGKRLFRSLEPGWCKGQLESARVS